MTKDEIINELNNKTTENKIELYRDALRELQGIIEISKFSSYIEIVNLINENQWTNLNIFKEIESKLSEELIKLLSENI